MARSSILGGEHAASIPAGTDVDALGPSDSSDSGSDVQTDAHHAVMPDEASEGAFPIEHGTSADAAGTGERASSDPSAPGEDSDILPDRIGTVPFDALDAQADVGDPTADAADELAAADDESDDDEGED